MALGYHPPKKIDRASELSRGLVEMNKRLAMIFDLDKGVSVYHSSFNSKSELLEKIAHLKESNPDGDYDLIYPDTTKVRRSRLIGRERYETVIVGRDDKVVASFGTSKVSECRAIDLEASHFYQKLRKEQPNAGYRLDFLVNFKVKSE